MITNENGPLPEVEVKVRLTGLPSQTLFGDALIVPAGIELVVTVTLLNGAPVLVQPLAAVTLVRLNTIEAGLTSENCHHQENHHHTRKPHLGHQHPTAKQSVVRSLHLHL